MRSAIVDSPIDPGALLREVSRSANGAGLLFIGTVRDVNEGRAVSGIEYIAYRPMAERELRNIALEAGERWQTQDVVVEHRIGMLALEDISVAIAIGHPHRAQAYEASRFVIEELKKRVPIWKTEQHAAPQRDWRQTPEGGQVLTMRASGEVVVQEANVGKQRTK